MADRPQPAEPRDAKAMEVPETVAVRATQEDLRGPHPSEDLPSARDIPRGKAVPEAASSPADKEEAPRQPGRPSEHPENDKHEAEANRVQRASDKDEAAEPRATFSAAAIKQASDGMTRFEVNKSDFEERSGMKLDKEKVYAMEAEISGVGSVRKIYDGNSETDRLTFFAPKEKSDSIPAGERHDVRIDSVKEVSSTKESLGTFFATAYAVAGREGREDSVRLDIPKATFERRTGFHFEDGKTYEGKGKVDGVHEFKVTHTGSSENRHVVISFFGEEAKRIEVGKEHTITVESIEEKRTLTVSGEGPTTRLTLQKRMLESLGVDVGSMKSKGADDRLVEVTARNLSSADKTERKVYGRMQPEGALPLSIGRAGARPGDEFELRAAKQHTVKNFVEEFNKHTGDATKNVRLSLEGERLYLEVDGKRFLAKSYRLDVHHLQTYLSVEMKPFKQDIRLWYDGERTTAKLAQSSRPMEDGSKPNPISWRIRSFAASERGLEVTFAMGDRTVTTRSAPDAPSERMSMEEISQRIRVDVGDRLEGSHPIRIEDDLASHINDRITRTRLTNSPYYFERGSLGEDIGAAAMSKMGWDEVARHPFDESGPGREPSKTGSDALYKNRDTGELVIVEFRWWTDSDAAMQDALAGVRRRKDDERGHREYGNISGAYVASLTLELRSNRGELRVKRAW